MIIYARNLQSSRYPSSHPYQHTINIDIKRNILIYAKNMLIIFLPLQLIKSNVAIPKNLFAQNQKYETLIKKKQKSKDMKSKKTKMNHRKNVNYYAV